jgi:hypothetical protein
MTAPLVTGWETWAPPLDPPASGGLSADLALSIAELSYWPESPHLTAALQWEAYAATLEPTLPVSTVSTGAQSVGFDPAAAPGPYGAAIRQAQWHRSFLSDLMSVPLYTDTAPGGAAESYPEWVGPPGPAGTPGAPGTPAGSAYLFEYDDFAAGSGTPPTSGQVQSDNADPTLVTKLSIATDTASGRDAARYMSNLAAGDSIDIQDEDDSSKFVTYLVTGPEVSFGTYIEVPVSWVSGGGP